MLTAPKVDHYISCLKDIPYRQYGHTHAYDDKTYELLDELFEVIQQIKPIKENTRCLWIRAPRGDISEFGNYEEWLEEEMCKDYDDFKETWLVYYPTETKWYELVLGEDKEISFRFIVLGHKIVIEDDKREERSSFPYEISEFVEWILDEVKNAIIELKAGTYNDTVNRELTPELKTGTIIRKDLWDVFPETREEFFKDISKEDCEKFVKLAYAQVEESKEFREKAFNKIPEMTAEQFYYYCSLGYATNDYSGCDKTPKEQYYLHADGRDDGLSEIDEKSPEAFREWLHDNKRGGGHPWEVCRGGNSTHISLYVYDTGDGYILALDGDAWNRTIETVKFYLALVKNKIPVYLYKAKLLADRLTEKEKIGIVPQGVIPAYCESYFSGEDIIDFMNLPYEEEDLKAILPYCKWQPLDAIELY